MKKMFAWGGDVYEEYMLLGEGTFINRKCCLGRGRL